MGWAEFASSTCIIWRNGNAREWIVENHKDRDRLSRVLKFPECGRHYTSAKCRYYLTILFIYAFHAAHQKPQKHQKAASPIAMWSIIYGYSDSPSAVGQTKLSPSSAAAGKKNMKENNYTWLNTSVTCYKSRTRSHSSPGGHPPGYPPVQPNRSSRQR